MKRRTGVILFLLWCVCLAFAYYKMSPAGAEQVKLGYSPAVVAPAPSGFSYAKSPLSNGTKLYQNKKLYGVVVGEDRGFTIILRNKRQIPIVVDSSGLMVKSRSVGSL